MVIGGSFDRLHAGHRRLLKLVCALRPLRLVVGVTGDAMLRAAGKPGFKLVQPFPARRDALIRALGEYAPACLTVVEVHELLDPFGPSVVDSELTAIAASTETEAGAVAVNARRSQAGLRKLDVFLVGRHMNAV